MRFPKVEEAIAVLPPGESLAGWLARARDGRQRTALLGDCDADDVADPVGGPQQAYAETAATLSQLLDRLVDLCWPPSGEPGQLRAERRLSGPAARSRPRGPLLSGSRTAPAPPA